MLLEIISASLQQAGIPIFLGSAVLGAVIGWGFKKFNLIYLTTHQVGLVIQACSDLIIYGILKVDKTSKRHGGEIVAQVLQAHNVRHVFTLPGGHISPILAAAEKTGIKVIDTRHEVLSHSKLSK